MYTLHHDGFPELVVGLAFDHPALRGVQLGIRNA
ncbi:hypothetical protein JYK04_01608 [Streptomyces nojiriensis]|nr:hypothetical protein JYK04_01608 [Streptomyces nojiriensis]